MHSSPIDLLTSAPIPQKAAPEESEPDGRFSELLRGPTETEAGQADVAARAKSKQAAPADDPSPLEAGIEAGADAERHPAVETADDPAGPEAPAADKPGIIPLAVVPEAIAWTQPQSGAVAGGAPATASELPFGAPVGETPKPADATATPSAAPTAPNTARAPIPTGSAIGTSPTARGLIPTNAATPVDGSSPAGPTEPGDSGAITATPAKASPAAADQPVVATAAPVAAVGKTIAGDGTPGQTTRISATVQGDAEAADTGLPNRPTSAPTSTPGHLATTHIPVSTSVRSKPARKEMPDLLATAETKAGPELNRSATIMPTPKSTATPAATLLATEKPAATAATGIPSTVAEIADTAPSASQADPVAATNSAPIGRMTVTAGSSTQFAHTQPAAQPAAEQVVLQVQRAVRDGVDRLTMQLKPASLGRVDIQMEVGFDGRLQAVISAERPETLHLLQRDARALTEALNDAGLQTDSGSLSFNLRGQSGDHGGGDGNEPSGQGSAAHTNAADDMTAATTEITLTLGDGRVDIKV